MSNPSLRKKRLIVLVTILLAFVVLVLLNTVDFSETPNVTTNAPYTPDTLPEHYFEVDPTVDHANNPDYLAKNRTPLYTDSNGTTEPLATAADYPYTDFFKSYFGALQAGDHTALNALYSDVYYRKHTPLTSLTRQLVYDVEITRLPDEDVIDTADNKTDSVYLGWKLVYFEVIYKIYQNDGTFRRDIAGDMAIVQIFTLLTDEGGNDPQLNSISYYHNTTPSAPSDTPSLLPLVLPLVWAGLAVIALVLVLILKKTWTIAATVAAFTAFLVSIKGTLVWQLLALTLTFAAVFTILFFLKKKKAAKSETKDTPETPTETE